MLGMKWENAPSFKSIHFSRSLLVLTGAENEPMVLAREPRVNYQNSSQGNVYPNYFCQNAAFRAYFWRIAAPGTNFILQDDSMYVHCT